VNEPRFPNNFIGKRGSSYVQSIENTGFVNLRDFCPKREKTKILKKNIYAGPVFEQAILI
jgi:hypothetical protein